MKTKQKSECHIRFRYLYIWILAGFFCVLQVVGSNICFHQTETGSLLVRDEEEVILQIQDIWINYEATSQFECHFLSETHATIELTFPHTVIFESRGRAGETVSTEVQVILRGKELHLLAEPEWAERFTIVLKDLGGHTFGLSEPLQPFNQNSPDLRGYTIDVEVDSEPRQFRENFASAYSSFFMNSRGYGAFFDTFAKGKYSFADRGNHLIHHETGILDWHVFFGSNGTEILKSYYDLIGSPKSVPIWAMGPVMWRDQNKDSIEILDDIEHMTALEIPVTAWFLDRPYSDGAHNWSQMNFSENFADPLVWISKIRDQYGIAFMTWTATAFFGDTRFSRHLDEEFAYLDLSHEESIRMFCRELREKQHVFGVQGHKMDRTDEQLSIEAPWYDRTIPEPMRRNKYTYLFAKVHDEALRKTWGKDQFTFARAAIHRAQPFLSAVWGGDPRSSWDGLQKNFANGMRCGFMGFPVWGSDVGGYVGEGYIPEELYSRWLMAGSMSGLFEIKLDGDGGKGRDRLPWNYPASLQNTFRRACVERMRWLPTLYSLANTSASNGVIMQPMAYRHLDDPDTYDIWDQFYVGDRVLVAPVFTPGKNREVYLPSGLWYTWAEVPSRVEGNQTIAISAELNELPRFVPAGRSILTGNVYAGNSSVWSNASTQLHLDVFPDFGEYEDAFVYVDYLDEDFQKEFKTKGDENGLELTIPPLSVPLSISVILMKEPANVESDQKRLNTYYSSEKHRLGIELVPSSRTATLIRIRY